MFNRPALCRAALLASFLLIALARPAHSQTLSFALFGDVHVTSEHAGYLKGMLDDMAQKDSAFAIFTGGSKPADQGCGDSNLLAAYPLFAQAPLPTFFLPGDADWLLCSGYAPEERLTLLRQTYYPRDFSLGAVILPLVRQPDYPELMRWQSGPALFVTLNVTGNNNQRGEQDTAATAYKERNAANLAWLQAAFDEARTGEISVIVIAMHGDPEFDDTDGNAIPRGYHRLVELLKNEAETFPGQILLAHGGNGVHRIDHPLLNANHEPYQNFTRVETYSALQQGWVQVRIESNPNSDGNATNRLGFHFESFPWPPLSNDSGDAPKAGPATSSDETTEKSPNPAIGEPQTVPLSGE